MARPAFAAALRAAIAAALLAGWALVAPAGVGAHALLISSDPAAGSSLAAAPAVVTLTFGEAADPRLSSVHVLDTAGREAAAGPAESVAGRPTQLRMQRSSRVP